VAFSLNLPLNCIMSNCSKHGRVELFCMICTKLQIASTCFFASIKALTIKDLKYPNCSDSLPLISIKYSLNKIVEHCSKNAKFIYPSHSLVFSHYFNTFVSLKCAFSKLIPPGAIDKMNPKSM